MSRAQWLAGGLTDEVVETRVTRGQWQRPHAGIVVLHSGPLAYDTRCWVAVLAIGGQVALARESVLWWLHRQGAPPRAVHLSVSRGRTVPRMRGVVVRHDLRPWTVLLTSGLPLTSAEDAVLDITARAKTAREVETVVCEAVRLRRTQPHRLAAALRLRPRHSQRALLTAMLTEVAAGAQSPLELMDLRNDERHGLPVAQRQVHYRAGGEGRWLDAEYTPPGDGRPVQKELDGRLGHEETPGKFRDRKRDNAATLRGSDALRYGWHDLADDGCEVALEEITLMRRNGFGMVGHPCGPGCPVR